MNIARTISEVIKIGGVWINLCPHGYTLDCCNVETCMKAFVGQTCDAIHETSIQCKLTKCSGLHVAWFGRTMASWRGENDALHGYRNGQHLPTTEWPIVKESANKDTYDAAVLAACKASERINRTRFDVSHGNAHADAFIELLAHREVLDPKYLAYNIEMRLRWRWIESTTDEHGRIVWADNGTMRTLQVEDVYRSTTTEQARSVMAALVQKPPNEPRETFVRILREASRYDPCAGMTPLMAEIMR